MTQTTLTLNETIRDWTMHTVKITHGAMRGRWDVFVAHKDGTRIPAGQNAHDHAGVQKETARLRALLT